MALSFGTSGVRGLVTEMTDLECYLYGKAFAQHLQQTGATTVCLAGDFRSSTPRIMQAVAYAIQESGEMIVERVEGSISNVIGFPLRLFFSMLGSLGIIRETLNT